MRIEPLAARRTRLKLLLSSYLDACESSGDGARGDKPSSRALLRNEELWNAGSYKALERSMDALRLRFPLVYRSTHLVYVLAPRLSPLRDDAARLERWVDSNRGDPPKLADRLTTWRAVFGLILLSKVMPRTIHVPAEISESAGYLPGEAKFYERRKQAA